MGELVGDRYRLADRIASGGMGEVWRAVDETLNRTVAVKMLHPRLVTDAGFGERFRREARAMASLHHSGVAEVYDYGETSQPEAPGLAYIVMEFVQGQPLSQRIAEVGRLDTAETMSVAAQTARALQAAHDAGVVHRDVKPSNLIIQPDGHVVLVDFGVAVTPEAASLTGTNQVVGTALYMAPEQVSKNETTPAIDIYALGAVVYQCLAGRPPYEGGNPVAVALRHLDDEPPPLPEDVPAAARDLVATAMAKNPAHRFPTAAAMAAAARALADSSDPQVTAAVAAASTGVQAADPAAPPPARGGAPGRGRTTAAVVLALLAALAAVLVFADPAGLMPGPFERPSAPPPASPPRGGSSPGTGGGDPAVSRSAGAVNRAPSTTSTTGGPEGAPGRPGPSTGSSGDAPRPTTSESSRIGPTAEPTVGTTVKSTADPTADSTSESSEEPAGGSTVGATAEPQVGRTP